MTTEKKYLLDIGFDDSHLPELFNDDDKSYYTIPELMKAYHQSKLREELIEFASYYNEEMVETVKEVQADSDVIDNYLKQKESKE